MSETGSGNDEVRKVAPKEDKERSVYDLSSSEVISIISSAMTFYPALPSKPDGMSNTAHSDMFETIKKDHFAEFDEAKPKLAVGTEDSLRSVHACRYCSDRSIPDGTTMVYATNSPEGLSQRDRGKKGEVNGKEIMVECIPNEHELRAHPERVDEEVVDALRRLIAFSQGEEVRPVVKEQGSKYDENIRLENGKILTIPAGTSPEARKKILEQGRRKLPKEFRKKEGL